MVIIGLGRRLVVSGASGGPGGRHAAERGHSGDVARRQSVCHHCRRQAKQTHPYMRRLYKLLEVPDTQERKDLEGALVQSFSQHLCLYALGCGSVGEPLLVLYHVEEEGGAAGPSLLLLLLLLPPTTPPPQITDRVTTESDRTV
ncbi:hypothetical protein NHX12_013623 [Muraenolepis orangiensis]|uniref:Uncharacterized protein n=1 Tax=Muraenolepis orangiensis TaxID=630683 RepID=A0A9Q0DDA0_9TELE|nr:hypothetical protein NHX12_013623 [Muraenolepis orangiensis]